MDIPYRYTYNSSSFAHYWTKGVGVQLLEKLSATPDIDHAKAYIPLLFTWDKLGDQVVIETYLKHGFGKAHRAMEDFIDKKPVEPAFQQVFTDFFNNIDFTPDWLDWDRLRKGQELCQRPGITSMIVLRDYCLMGGYESAAINKPLIYTGALKKGAVKRLVDTVEFWVQIGKADNLHWGKDGFKEIIKTRMIHSFARVGILDRSDWDSKRWGVPINTWDMLATNLGFSQVFLTGLRLMGLQPTAAEIDGLFHFWKYIGYLLGIPLELLPDNEEQAIEALYYWTMTQREGDEDSKSLAKALENQPVESYYPKNALMRRMMREIHLFYNQFLLGPYSCKMLGLSTTTVGRFAIANVWRNRKSERNMHLEGIRKRAIDKGAAEQEDVRNIYQEFNA